VVAGLHIFQNVVEMTVLNEPGIAVHYQHAAGSAVRQRAIRYQFFRQVVIEIDGAHICSAGDKKQGATRAPLPVN
jgi:hypothetical protein